MAEIQTRPGETLSAKHACLESARLTSAEHESIEAEEALDFAHEQWGASGKRALHARVLAQQSTMPGSATTPLRPP